MRGGAKLAITKGIELLHLAFSLQMVEMQRMALQSVREAYFWMWKPKSNCDMERRPRWLEWREPSRGLDSWFNDLFGEVSFDYRASKYMILRQVSFTLSPLAFSLLNLYSTGRVTPKIKGLNLPDKGDVLNETLENWASVAWIVFPI